MSFELFWVRWRAIRIRRLSDWFVRNGFTYRALRGRDSLHVLALTCFARWLPGSLSFSNSTLLSLFPGPFILVLLIPISLLLPMALPVSHSSLCTIAKVCLTAIHDFTFGDNFTNHNSMLSITSWCSYYLLVCKQNYLELYYCVFFFY